MLALAPVAGCGSSGKNEYGKDFRPVNDRLVQLGEKVGRSASSATGKSDREIEREFGGYADQVALLRRQFDDLDPPGGLKADQQDLSSALGDAGHALNGIENAAREHSPDGARRSTLALVQASRKLRAARLRLVRAIR